MMKARLLTLAILLPLLLLEGCASAPPATSKAAIATAHPLATQAGFRALDQGGNAFDAAIASAAVLSVVEPYSAGLGGGSFWLLQNKNGKSIVIDAQGKAPEKAHRNMYVDKRGERLQDKPSTNGAIAAAIPGQAAAFSHISEHYGIRPLAANLSDAIRLANKGFRVDRKYQRLANYRLRSLNKHAYSKKIFLEDGTAPTNHYIIKQAKLARTLNLLGKKGHKGFYEGETAEKLIADVTSSGGIWTLQDLNEYQVIERPPIIFDYKNSTIIAPPPPSFGGFALQQMLNILEQFDTSKLNKIERAHLISEIMRQAYRDKAEWLGDADFIDIPLKQLTSSAYLNYLANTIDSAKVTASEQISLSEHEHEDKNTRATHLSIVDKWGNKVSATLTINLPFGSAFTSPSTGVLLNNEMDEFSIQPGKPNVYGLVSSEKNAIAPGKRPLSSMTPLIIESPESVAIIGTSGGVQTITTTLIGVLDYIDNKTANEMVNTPRFHHQHLPNAIQHEPSTFSENEIQELKVMGHTLTNTKRQYGDMQSIYINKLTADIEAASDPRGKGQAIVR